MGATVAGVDVSNWQGAVSWGKVKAAGIGFAIARATEGALRPGTRDVDAIKLGGLDPYFRANWKGMQAAGLVRGAYHFLRVDLGNTPEAEADWFLSVVAPYLAPGDLLVLDAEKRAAWDSVGRFCRRVRARVGFTPMFYTYQSWPAAYGVTYARTKAFGVDPGLWLSAPDVASPPAPVGGWPFVAMWQRAPRPVAGVGSSAPDDSDLFLGTLDQLRKYGKPGLNAAGSGTLTPPKPTPAPVPVPAPPPTAPPSSPPPTTAPQPPPASPPSTPAPPPPEVPPVQNPPIVVPPDLPIPTPPDIPEPPPIAEAGIDTSEWKALVRYAYQLAGVGTLYVVNLVAGAIAHTSISVPQNALIFIGGLELAGVIGVATYVIGRSIRKKGTGV